MAQDFNELFVAKPAVWYGDIAEAITQDLIST